MRGSIKQRTLARLLSWRYGARLSVQPGEKSLSRAKVKGVCTGPSRGLKQSFAVERLFAKTNIFEGGARGRWFSPRTGENDSRSSFSKCWKRASFERCKIFLTRLRRRSTFVLTPLEEEKAECPVPSKPFRLRPLAADRAAAARLAKAGRKETIVGCLNHGVSIAGAVVREGVMEERAWKWRRNGLKRLNSRREMVWPRQRRTPISGTGARRDCRPRRIPVASRRRADASG